MAYINQQTKKEIATALKLALKNVNIKYSLSIKHHSTIVCTIAKSDIDFLAEYNAKAVVDHRTSWSSDDKVLHADTYLNVNEYYLDSGFEGKALEVLKAIKECLLTPDYFDESDSQTDYFHCSHYISIKIGSYDKPFELIAK